jgi:hypothetical protein
MGSARSRKTAAFRSNSSVLSCYLSLETRQNMQLPLRWPSKVSYYAGGMLSITLGSSLQVALLLSPLTVTDKMDLAIGVAVGSSMQVALFLIPLLIVIGWIMGNDCMTLSFDGFQVAVLFVAVLLVNYLIGDGKSHVSFNILMSCFSSLPLLKGRKLTLQTIVARGYAVMLSLPV